VKDLIVNRPAQRVDAIRVAGLRKNAEYLPWSVVRSFGTDAVVVESEPAETEQSREFGERAEARIVGSRVLTTTGEMVGKVTDVRFETGDGTILAVDTDRGTIEAARLRSIGSYALVVVP
jgi:uncharacterized protein YrrD